MVWITVEMYNEAAGRTSDTTCCRSSMNGWKRVDRVSCDRDEIETFRSDLNQAATDTRQIQEFVHESQECLRLGIDCVEQFDGCGILVGFAQQVNRVCDRRQWVTQFVP